MAYRSLIAHFPRPNVRFMSTEATPVANFTTLWDSIQSKTSLKKSEITRLAMAIETQEDLDQMKSALDLYEKRFIDPNAQTALLYVKKCMEFQDTEKLIELLDGDMRLKLFCEDSVLNHLFVQLEKQHQNDKIIEFFELAQSNDFSFSRKAYNILFKAYLRTDQDEKACDLVKTLAAKNQASRFMYHLALTKCESSDEVAEILRLMEHNQIEQSQVTKAIIESIQQDPSEQTPPADDK